MFEDRIFLSVSAVAGAGAGAFTVSGAVTQSGVTFEDLAQRHDGYEFDCVAFEAGLSERFRAVYTHSTRVLSRGALLSGTSGTSRVTFTTAAKLMLSASADTLTWLARAMQAVTPGGRVTTEQGVPVSTSDRTAQSVLYWVPGPAHNTLPLYDSIRAMWLPLEAPEFAGVLAGLTNARPYDDSAFLTTLTASSTNTTTDTLTYALAHLLMTGAFCRPLDSLGGLAAGTLYWVNVASTTTLTLHATLAGALAGTGKIDLTANITQPLQYVSREHAAWTDDTTRATAVTLQDGRYCKSGDKTRLLLGTFSTTSATTTEDSDRNRHLSNVYNRVTRFAQVFVGGGSFAGAERNFNNNDDTLLRWTCALPGKANLMGFMQASPTNSGGSSGMQLWTKVGTAGPVSTTCYVFMNTGGTDHVSTHEHEAIVSLPAGRQYSYLRQNGFSTAGIYQVGGSRVELPM